MSLIDLAGQGVEGRGGGTAHELTDRGEILSCLARKVKKRFLVPPIPSQFLDNRTANRPLASGSLQPAYPSKERIERRSQRQV